MGGQAIDILHLIDSLEEIVGAARRLPVGEGVIVSRVRLLDIIDRLRVAVPAEVQQAMEVMQRRDEVLAAAQAEARDIVARAQEEAQRLVAEHAVTQEAEERGRQIMQEAGQRASDILRQAEAQAATRLDEAARTALQQMEDADRYALEMLTRLETQMSTFLTAVRNGIRSLQERRR